MVEPQPPVAPALPEAHLHGKFLNRKFAHAEKWKNQVYFFSHNHVSVVYVVDGADEDANLDREGRGGGGGVGPWRDFIYY